MTKKGKMTLDRLEIENPFEKVTVEQFNDDYSLIAYLFARPKPAIYGKLIGRENYVIVGGWGSGKTMLLKYLALETQIEDVGVTNVRDADFVGVYLKPGRGAFKPFLKPGGEFKESGQILFGHYFNLVVLEKLILLIMYGRDKGVFDISTKRENNLCEGIMSKFSFCQSIPSIGFRRGKGEPRDLPSIRQEVVSYRREIETFLNTRDLESDLSYSAKLSIAPTDTKTFLDEVARDIRGSIPNFVGKRFYILLDECEQFSKGQQRVINTIIKQRLTTLVFKLATRPPDIHTPETIDVGIGLTDRECKHLYLDKEYTPTSASFKELCRAVAKKRLEKSGYEVTDISKILGKYTIEEEVGGERLVTYLKENYPVKGRTSDQARFHTVLKDFKVAAGFQILRKTGVRKKYAGFDTFAMLSSGIMVHFLELCRNTFNLSFGKDIVRNKSGQPSFRRTPLPVETQDEAAHSVSEDFYREIRGRAESLKDSPIDMEFGDRIQYVVSVIGGIFREKLMSFVEPEAARLEIPEGLGALDKSANNPIHEMFNTTLAISVFQEGNPYMPQHIGGIRPPTYILNRVLAPYLKISPRPRWRTKIKADVLNKILQVSDNEFKSEVFGKKRRQKRESKEEEKVAPVPKNQLALPLSQLSDTMPVLTYLGNKVTNQPLRGKTLLILLHFLRDLIPFIEACKKAGASPSGTAIFYKDYRYPNRESIENNLTKGGHKVYPISEIDNALGQLSIKEGRNLIIIEDGGTIVPRLHATFRKLGAVTLGAVEQTTRGIRNDRLIKMHAFPIIAIPGSKLKDTFEPPHVARAVVDNIQRLLPDKNFSGKSALVVGYGSIGEQIALQLRDSLRMNVSVHDSDDAKLIKAQQYGFNIQANLIEGIKGKLVVVGATGETVVARSEILAMEHNVCLVSASSEQWEFCIPELDALSSEKCDLCYGTDKIGTKYKIRNTGREVNLIADGYPINFWATESMPNEVSDLIMSLMFVCTVEVATSSSLPLGINQDIVNDLAERYELARIYLEYHSR